MTRPIAWFGNPVSDPTLKRHCAKRCYQSVFFDAEYPNADTVSQSGASNRGAS